jgi:hypothetical protein
MAASDAVGVATERADSTFSEHTFSDVDVTVDIFFATGAELGMVSSTFLLRGVLVLGRRSGYTSSELSFFLAFRFGFDLVDMICKEKHNEHIFDVSTMNYITHVIHSTFLGMKNTNVKARIS